MNPYSGHVVADIESVPSDARGDYVPLSGALSRRARRLLAGRSEMTIPLNSNSMLAKAARAHRKERRRLEKQGRKNARGK